MTYGKRSSPGCLLRTARHAGSAGSPAVAEWTDLRREVAELREALRDGTSVSQSCLEPSEVISTRKPSEDRPCISIPSCSLESVWSLGGSTVEPLWSHWGGSSVEPLWSSSQWGGSSAHPLWSSNGAIQDQDLSSRLSDQLGGLSAAVNEIAKELTSVKDAQERLERVVLSPPLAVKHLRSALDTQDRLQKAVASCRASIPQEGKQREAGCGYPGNDIHWYPIASASRRGAHVPLLVMQMPFMLDVFAGWRGLCLRVCLPIQRKFVLPMEKDRKAHEALCKVPSTKLQGHTKTADTHDHAWRRDDLISKPESSLHERNRLLVNRIHASYDPQAESRITTREPSCTKHGNTSCSECLSGSLRVFENLHHIGG